jgi:biopolymer transport protein ExbD
MIRDLAVFALILMTTIFAMGQTKKKLPAPPPLEDPMKSPNRLLVSLLSDGRITLNDENVTDLRRLGKLLQRILEERQLFQKAVIIQAPPEMKYGKLMAVLDVIASSGGSPIIPFIEGLSDSVSVELTKAPDQFDNPAVNLPSVVGLASTPAYRKNSAVVTIPKTGTYIVSGSIISLSVEGYERTLALRIKSAMESLRPEDPDVLYINCDQDAHYSDIQQVIKAAQTRTTLIALWVKRESGAPIIGVHRSIDRRNRKR